MFGEGVSESRCGGWIGWLACRKSCWKQTTLTLIQSFDSDKKVSLLTHHILHHIKRLPGEDKMQ
jgi:hypothetical protein